MVTLTKVPFIKTPPYIAITLKAALASVITSVEASALTLITYGLVPEVKALIETLMKYLTLKVKVMPMKLTGDGSPTHTLKPQFPE